MCGLDHPGWRALLAGLVVAVAGCGDDGGESESATSGVSTAALTSGGSATSTTSAGSASSADDSTSTASDATSEVSSSGGASSSSGAPEPTPIVIDFDDARSGLALGEGYSKYAVFSTEAGDEVFAYLLAEGVGTSVPNIICTRGASPTCEADLYVDFAVPAYGLTINLVGVNVVGTTATLRIVREGGAIDLVPIESDKDHMFEPMPLDLSEYAAITRLEFLDPEPGYYGIGFDDFAFEIYGEP